MTNAIAEFYGTNFKLIEHNQQLWLTAEQVGLALGYNEANVRVGINNLYNRHADEFSKQDSTVINLMTVDKKMRDVRIFSATGCQLLGFFSNTERAKAFRQWAKVVLVGKAPSYPSAKPVKRGEVLVNRHLERQCLELFVQGVTQASIADKLRIGTGTVSMIIQGRYQFSDRAGFNECSDELLDAVAQRVLYNEQQKLLKFHQRQVNRLRNDANNAELASRINAVGHHLAQPLDHAALPLLGEEL